MTRLFALIPAFALALSACGGTAPSTLGPMNGGLPPCPSSPNCVHTGDRHPEGTAPMILAAAWSEADPADLWLQVEEAVASLPRTEIITVRPGYLHAASTSRIFRFVDDVEVVLDPARGELVVRSASRVGQSDMGVNADRVEALRLAFQERGLLSDGL